MAIGGFVFIHLAMVVLAGPLNLLRSMITGWMVIRTDEASK
jgi:thiosulfate reductase cytochrome b subunit